MIKLVTDYISKLAEEENLSDDNIYLFLVLIVSTIFAGLMHVALLFVMLGIALPFLAMINAISISIYAFALIRLIRKKQYTSAGVIIAGEVIFYILTVSFYIGTAHYIILYYFVIIFMQLVIPYGEIKVRATVIMVTWLSMITSLVIGVHHAPIHEILSQGNSMFLLMSNVNLAFGGVIVLLVSSNTIRAIIAKSNTARLEQYKNQAHTDSLTGLYNRRYSKIFFADVLEKQAETPWCVAMLDLDNFKHINDTLGHLAGDEVLRSVSNILKKNLRKTDVLFRWGGEEFLLFLSNVELKSAVIVLEKILKQIASTSLSYGKNAINFTVTIGVCLLDINEIESSIEFCDKLLYKGKSTGKNVVIFSDLPNE